MMVKLSMNFLTEGYFMQYIKVDHSTESPIVNNITYRRSNYTFLVGMDEKNNIYRRN